MQECLRHVFFYSFCSESGMVTNEFSGPLAEQSLDQVKQIFETNTFAVLRICKAVVPIMAKRNAGTIVNIGSVMGNLSVFDFK